MMLLDRGTLGPSWQVERDRLAPVKEAVPGGSVTRLDCAWDERVEVRPGFVNAHTHLYSGLASFGMPSPKTPPANFVEILKRVWWRLDRARRCWRFHPCRAGKRQVGAGPGMLQPRRHTAYRDRCKPGARLSRCRQFRRRDDDPRD